MHEHDDEIARLRAELATTPPGSERDFRVRPELAVLLLRRFEDLAERNEPGSAPDPGDLAEILEHAHHMVGWFEWGSDTWLGVVELRVFAHQYLHETSADPNDLDAAIAGQRVLVQWSEGVHELVKLADLLVVRYSSMPDDECADMLEAATVLKAKAIEELSAPERIEVEFRLGLYLVELLRWDRAFGTPTADQATEALAVLARTFALLDPDDPRCVEVLLETARAHASRSGLEGADTEADQAEAITVFRSLASTDTRAALGLGAVLAKRYEARADRVDRDEAIAVFQRLHGRPDLETTPEDLASLLGELLLDRAKEKPHEAESLVRYMEDVVREVGATDPVLGTLLIDACFLLPSPSVAEITRVIARMDSLMIEYPAGTPDHPPLLPMKAAAQAARALRTSSAHDLAAAEKSLRVTSRDVHPFDWSHLLLLGLLGAVVVVRHGGDATRWPNPMRLARDFPSERRVEVLGLLEESRNGQLVEHPDLLCAVALLRADATEAFEGGDVAEHESYRRKTVRLLESALASLSVGDELEVVLTQQLGNQYADLGRLLESAPEIDRALDLFDGLLGRTDAGHPLYSTTAMLYAVTVMVARLHSQTSVSAQHAKTVLARAGQDLELDVSAQAILLHARGMVEAMVWAENSAEGDLTAGVDLLKQAMSLVPLDDPQHDRIRLDLAALLADRYGSYGELHDFDAALAHLQALLLSVRARGDRTVVDEASVVESIHQLTSRLPSVKSDALGAQLSALKTRLAELLRRVEAGEHVDGYVLATMHNSVAVALMRQAHATDDATAFAEAVVHFRAAREGIKPGTTAWAKFVMSASGSSAIAHALSADRTAFESDVRELAEVWGDPGLSDVMRVQAADTMIAAWLSWHTRTRDSAALDTALGLFDEVTAFGGEEHERGHTSILCEELADACWQRGSRDDVDRALDMGFQALRTQARDVLLQAASEHGLRQAADAAKRALVVVDRCLAAGLPLRAVEAVEWGRGLVLAATTATADVTTLLREGGRDDLAEEWHRSAQKDEAPPDSVVAVDFAPDDLRRRVLGALAGATHDRGLLAPPSVSAIATALFRSGSDVLVHLVPGRALLVTSHKRVFEVPLPLLPAEAPDEFDVEELCEWAWRVVMGPLLTRLLELGVSAGLPRLVLVPSGKLGVVPWHAARGGDRVAVREAVFSYAASGRQFCDLAARAHLPLGLSPVVVNDPTGDLPAAMLDAEFLHSRLPDGRFYGVEMDGVPHSGDGTSDDVLKAFADASLLHLGCHAQSGVTLARSFLQLTSTLSIDRVLVQARGRPVDAPGGLVVLAACQSDLSGADHDEALTLASAFVAAGASGVVGTKWEVHDIGASILICVFYTELLGSNPRPRDALRAAQLWALDPDRAVPEGMSPYLARQAKRLDLAHPSFWAAFTHQGW
ncbi:CHAT domain-containing protein [Umezawaea sp. NPDC059074]|uniref:CHAT domain-containing protein n=1 Tax=Umezawaea sp. NPDC059074 TaxID=3346716 RepID=UPI0036B4329F